MVFVQFPTFGTGSVRLVCAMPSCVQMPVFPQGKTRYSFRMEMMSLLQRCERMIYW